MTPLRMATRVALADPAPAPLACAEGAGPPQRPGLCTSTLPPLALGGWGGDALRPIDMVATPRGLVGPPSDGATF